MTSTRRGQLFRKRRVSYSQADCLVVLAKGFPPTPGGVETYSEQVCRAYIRAGLRVVAFTQTPGPVGWSTHETADGFIDLWNAGAGSQLKVSRRMAVAISRFSRREHVVGVHSTTWRVGVLGQLFFQAKPRVVTIHGREVMFVPRGAGWLMRLVLRRASLVMAVSSATLTAGTRAVATHATPNWVVSFNGLTQRPQPIEVGVAEFPKQVRLLSLCRLVPRKNIAELAMAAKLVNDKQPNSFLLKIVGTGPELERVQQLIAENELAEVVLVAGYVADETIPELYEWADVFVHPHATSEDGRDFEGFGIAIADAMANGCAIISGNSGGPLDFIEQGKTGLLVDGESPESIAEALDALILNPSGRQKLGANAREFAYSHFSWDAHVLPVLKTLDVTPRLTGKR